MFWYGTCVGGMEGRGSGTAEGVVVVVGGFNSTTVIEGVCGCGCWSSGKSEIDVVHRSAIERG